MDETNFKTCNSSSSRDVIDFYNNYAETWDKRFEEKKSTRDFHKVRLNSFLNIADLKETDRIIELGVGTGPYLRNISPLVREVVCIDGSENMLKVLQKNYQDLPNIELRQMDLESSLNEFPDKADKIYFFGLIEHILDIEAFVTNVQKMLRKNGHLIVVTPNGKCPWYGGIRSLWRSGKHCSTDKYYTKDQLDSIFKSYDFIPEKELYWGYFPAGAGNILTSALKIAGSVIDKTPLKKYAGGITISYRLNE